MGNDNTEGGDSGDTANMLSGDSGDKVNDNTVSGDSDRLMKTQ
jgi:hypothetical protein